MGWIEKISFAKLPEIIMQSIYISICSICLIRCSILGGQNSMQMGGNGRGGVLLFYQLEYGILITRIVGPLVSNRGDPRKKSRINEIKRHARRLYSLPLSSCKMKQY